MLGIIRWVLGKASEHWDWVTWAAAWFWTIAGGLVSGWAAKAAGVLSTYAPYSWVTAGILGALIAAFIFWLAARAGFWMVQAKLIRAWSSPGDGINPLDDNFSRKRIKVNDFISPAHAIIENKSFDRCELIGPATIVLQNANFINPAFFDCNFLCCKDNFPVYNAVVIKDTNLINCKIYRMNLIIPETLVGNLGNTPNVVWLSRIPAEFNSPVPFPIPHAVQQQIDAIQPKPPTVQQ